MRKQVEKLRMQRSVGKGPRKGRRRNATKTTGSSGNEDDEWEEVDGPGGGGVANLQQLVEEMERHNAESCVAFQAYVQGRLAEGSREAG